jgi:hypothetical protein
MFKTCCLLKSSSCNAGITSDNELYRELQQEQQQPLLSLAAAAAAAAAGGGVDGSNEAHRPEAVYVELLGGSGGGVAGAAATAGGPTMPKRVAQLMIPLGPLAQASMGPLDSLLLAQQSGKRSFREDG